MSIIRINTLNESSDEEISSLSEYSLSPIRVPNINRRQIISESNLSYRNNNSLYCPFIINNNNSEEDEFGINLDLESNFTKTNDICLICADNFIDICKLRCGHYICLKCLIKWLSQSNTCPFCREEINNVNLDYLNAPNSDSNTSSSNEVEHDVFSLCRVFERVVCYTSLFYCIYVSFTEYS